MDKYEFIKQVEKTSFSTIFLYSERATGKEVIIKVIKKLKKEETDEEYHCMPSEVTVLKMLANPERRKRYEGGNNIVNLIEVIDDEDPKWIAMVLEFSKIGDMFNYFNAVIVRISKMDIVSGYYESKIAAPIFKDICKGLRYMHKHNIAHRDIKLENILLFFSQEEQRVVAKLADFGFSIPVDPDLGVKEFKGSPHYAPPETFGLCYEGEENFVYPLKCDMWSLGVVLYVLTFHCLPFDPHTEPDEVLALLSSKELNVKAKKGMMDIFKNLSYPFIPTDNPVIHSTLKTIVNLINYPSKRWDIDKVLNQDWLNESHIIMLSARSAVATGSASSSSSSTSSFISPHLPSDILQINHIHNSSSSSQSSSRPSSPGFVPEVSTTSSTAYNSSTQMNGAFPLNPSSFHHHHHPFQYASPYPFTPNSVTSSVSTSGIPTTPDVSVSASFPAYAVSSADSISRDYSSTPDSASSQSTTLPSSNYIDPMHHTSGEVVEKKKRRFRFKKNLFKLSPRLTTKK